MENFFTERMIPLTVALTLVFEVWRFRRLRALDLEIDSEGEWQYVRYLGFFARLAILGSVLSAVAIWMLSWVWTWILSLKGTPYLAGFFLVILAGLVAGLLYVALGKVQETRDKLRLMVLLLLLGLSLFVFEPARFIFGGTLLLLVTSAAGQVMKFTNWDEIVAGLRREDGKSKQDQVDLVFIVKAQAKLRRYDALEEAEPEQPGQQEERPELVRIQGDDAEKQPLIPLPRVRDARLTPYLVQRLTTFVEESWEEWVWQQARLDVEDVPRYLSVLLTNEFLPGWAGFLEATSWIVYQLLLETESTDQPPDAGTVEMRVQGVLDEKLQPALRDILDVTTPQEYVRYMMGLLRNLRKRLADLVIRDWKDLVAWLPAPSEDAQGDLQADQEAAMHQRICRWLDGEIFPSWLPGLNELSGMVGEILNCLEVRLAGRPLASAEDADEDADADADEDIVATCVREVVDRRLPIRWLDFAGELVGVMDDLQREVLPAIVTHKLSRQLVEKNQLDMLVRAVDQMTSRQDLLEQLTQVVADNLGWLESLHQDAQQEQGKQPGKGKKGKDEEGKKPGEKVEDQAAIRGKIYRRLTFALDPRWEGELEGVAQMLSRLLDSLSKKPGDGEIRRLIEGEMVVGWRDILDKLVDVVTEKLPELIELRQRRLGSQKAEAAIREILDHDLERLRLQNLFSWHYDMPAKAKGLRLYVTRTPPFEIKPLLGWPDYLGIALTYWDRQSKKARGHPRRG